MFIKYVDIYSTTGVINPEYVTFIAGDFCKKGNAKGKTVAKLTINVADIYYMTEIVITQDQYEKNIEPYICSELFVEAIDTDNKLVLINKRFITSVKYDDKHKLYSVYIRGMGQPKKFLNIIIPELKNGKD